ncbi:hypothetical protein [Streptomyces johnsoniae]|uniref:Secreted protein n=1 Tax=Streptomyces johnsoniae TaxID=3075532 RepID=A0ABU2SFT8_9ACTN|nr:hypothetical protein [Streptomyces sp. DSM 41886]MDT0446759.1 hypothetical protein [Streptomyces sp. DSM 41886]
MTGRRWPAALLIAAVALAVARLPRTRAKTALRPEPEVAAMHPGCPPLRVLPSEQELTRRLFGDAQPQQEE